MLRDACDELAQRDSRLAMLIKRNGYPPLRLRPEGFATLVHLILQQQVSRASALAVNSRLEELLSVVSPQSVLAASDVKLRQVGFSQQKIKYVRALAQRIESGELDLPDLRRRTDEAAIATLEAELGIGPWTASVYVLSALGRPDVWAPGDRALLVSLGRMLGSPVVPSSQEAEQVAEAWRPWRAVAARVLWHDYAVPEAV